MVWVEGCGVVARELRADGRHTESLELMAGTVGKLTCTPGI